MNYLNLMTTCPRIHLQSRSQPATCTTCMQHAFTCPWLWETMCNLKKKSPSPISVQAAGHHWLAWQCVCIHVCDFKVKDSPHSTPLHTCTKIRIPPQANFKGFKLWKPSTLLSVTWLKLVRSIYTASTTTLMFIRVTSGAFDCKLSPPIQHAYLSVRFP